MWLVVNTNMVCAEKERKILYKLFLFFLILDITMNYHCTESLHVICLVGLKGGTWNHTLCLLQVVYEVIHHTVNLWSHHRIFIFTLKVAKLHFCHTYLHQETFFIFVVYEQMDNAYMKIITERINNVDISKTDNTIDFKDWKHPPNIFYSV